MAEWPALKRWTPEFFKSNFGDKPVKVSTGEVLRFGDYIDLVLASTNEKPCPYLSGLHDPSDSSPRSRGIFSRS